MSGREPVAAAGRRRIPPLGMLALAAFVICAVSGLVLAPAYKPGSPLDSLALLLLKNPAGVFVRAVHYWSAQCFLIFTFAHTADHLMRRSEGKVRFGVWLRLGLSVPVILGGMLSGFLLRGDAAAVQALQILRTLLGLVPWIGASQPRLLAGSGPDLTTVYLHHICTATVAIWLVTVDHSRKIMPTSRAVWWALPPVLLLSVFLPPGLEWRAAAAEIGPWYLAGLQELLRWLPQPREAIWLGVIGLALLVLLPKFSLRTSARLKWGMAAATLAYLGLTMAGLAFRGDGGRLQRPATPGGSVSFLTLAAYVPADASLMSAMVPSIGGQREGCLACHAAMTGFSPAHDPRLAGCAACHLGNPFTLNRSLAHAGMTLTPGNLSVVNETCAAGNCHGEVAGRVRASLMNTMSGVVAVDKVAFGESGDWDARFDVAALQHSRADTHLRNLCASCHLGQDKPQPAPLDESSRGGGCSACHLQYDPAAAAELRRRGGLSSAPLHHPAISVNVPPQACFGCHSRSGRIAANYEGWHETLLDAAAAKAKPGWPAQYRQLADGRIFEKRTADVHAEKGMTCIDCHVAAEIMEGGGSYAHERAAVKVQCADCHAAGAAAAVEFAGLDPETQKIVALRKLNEPGRRFVVSPSGKAAYANVFLDGDGHPLLALKGSAKLLKPRPAAAMCSGSWHARLECGACHTAWAPQCVTCHTSFDRAQQGWDHLAGKFVNGEWQEQASDYLADAPALGIEQVRLADGETAERVTTFIPGMILDLELPDGDEQPRRRFRRLFAPASPHTTVTRARDCRSCHASPAALGYGRGQLTYVAGGPAGAWQFQPAFARSPADGLPADSWIGFLEEPPHAATTRNGARPFTLREQQNILLVGACLNCHNENEPRLRAVFADFKNYRAALGAQCRLPAWSGLPAGVKAQPPRPPVIRPGLGNLVTELDKSYSLLITLIPKDKD